MADDVRSETGYEHVTRNHEEIRRWTRQRGGRPAKVEGGGDGAADGDGLAVQFPGTDDEALVPIEWEQFFERFEAAGLAFAYATDPGSDDAEVDWALIDRERAAEVGGGGSVKEQREDGRDRPAGREAESRLEPRTREAMDDANADAHRDESPFNS